MHSLQLISDAELVSFLDRIPVDLEGGFSKLKDAEISTKSFSFYTSVASVFSSKIEGEEIELDSYIKHKRFGIEFSPDYTQKIDDLYEAYRFAQTHELSNENLAIAHQFLSRNLLPVQSQGKFRNQNMYVSTPDGKIEYVAASPFLVSQEMEKLFSDIQFLLAENLSLAESFYYAAYIHLVFVKIHPWNDGNGRSGRLLEKWFLASKLGEKAWLVQSEKQYYLHHQAYYQNIRKLGMEYESLDYFKALDFLLMLPNSVIEK